MINFITNQLYLLENISFEKLLTNGDVVPTRGKSAENPQLTLPSIGSSQPVTYSPQFSNGDYWVEFWFFGESGVSGL